MKTPLLAVLIAIPALSQQTFDFKSVEKLGEHAKSSTNIALEGDTLKMAAGLLGDENSSFTKNLKSVHVHSYEFDKEGQYKPSDLAAVRAYVKSLNWTKILDVKEEDEATEIYAQAPRNNQAGGLAIIAAEPKEVTVIVISGNISLSDLGKLENLGVPPNAVLDHGGKKSSDNESSKKD
jgi:hypothetical protein